VFYWVTDKVKEQGFDDELGIYLDNWLKTFWSFENPLYPGRNISLLDWERLAEEVKK